MNKGIACVLLSGVLWAAMCTGSVPIRAHAQQGDIISTEGDPAQACTEAKAAEDERHRRQLLELEKAHTDAIKDYNNRLIMCKADKECREQARQELDDKQRNIQTQHNEENAEHAKRQLDIKQRCEVSRKTVPPPQDTVARITKTIDQFFTDLFNSHGKTYTPPGVQRNPGLAKWDKDGKGLVGRPARYNTTTGELEYSPDYLRFIHDELSNYEVAVVLAHEVGHHAQLLAGQPFVKEKAKEWELQADRLSGAYLRYATGKPLAPDKEAKLLQFYRAVGGHDSTGHGTPEERLAAFKEGYEHGVPAELFE